MSMEPTDASARLLRAAGSQCQTIEEAEDE